MSEAAENADDLFGHEHVQRYTRPTARWATTGTRHQRPYPHHAGPSQRRSRSTPLLYQPHEGANLIVASNGGGDAPAWYLNIQEAPEVEIQIRDDRFTARARTAGPDEKPGMWRTMTDVWPDYDSYQEKTDREIPVVVLERQ